MTTPTTVNVRLQLRADTAANWTAANPTLLANEVGLETDTKKLKVGSGSTAWNSLAYFPSIVSGGTVLGNLEIGSTGTLTFEGSTADGFETTLAVTNPTADRTITLPNQSGTVVVSGNASIVNADIAANAEIAVSKLANGTANQVIVTDGTNVSWSDDLTLAGNLTVNGTTTTISTQNLLVEDKNIIIGDVATPTDTTADGGGITLKGATDKTINWVDATDAWTSSERFSVPLGSAASPSLTFTGDPNTGVFSPSADALALSTGGSERLRITSAGLVGIGTSSPVAKFQINVQDGFRFDVGANAYSYMQFGSANAGEATGEIGFERTTGSIYIKRGAPGSPSTALTIDANSRVGIGTTTVAGKLHTVLSPSYSPGSAWDDKAAVFGGATSTSGAFGIAYDDTNGAFLASIIPGFAWMPITVRGSAVVLADGTGERARIDSSGKLLIGTSSSITTLSDSPKTQVFVNDQTGASFIRGSANEFGSNIHIVKSRSASSGSRTIVQSGDELGTIFFGGDDGSTLNSIAARITAFVDGTPGANDMPGRLVFSTTADGASSSTERMRIASDGICRNFTSGGNGFYLASAKAASTGDNLFVGAYGATSIFDGTASFAVRTNGNVENTNNSYGALSDIKLKENIVDANSQWDDLKALQVRNYNFKEGQTHTQIGLVAQEVELVSPGLVSESPDRDEDGNDLGTVTKSVNYSVLYMKAVKALQEAMERIETLEAAVTALQQS